MMSFLKGTPTQTVFKWPWRSQPQLSAHLLADVPPQIELSDYRRLPSSASETPSRLLHGEDIKADLIPDLDIFFERLYEYFCAKGLRCIIIKWIIEILNVTFVLCSIGFFFLFVDWGSLSHLKCGVEALESGEKPCDLMKVIKNDPLVPFTFLKMVTVGSMVILTVYGLINFLKFFVKLRSTLNVRDFYNNSLKVTDLEIQTISWPRVVEKVVLFQKSQRLCVVKDLSEHDIIMRIMRKENYLIGMVNKGIIAFPISRWLPGAGPTVSSRMHGRKSYLMLPKTLEWSLNWCIFQSMFDRSHFMFSCSKFCVREDFLASPSLLKKRLIFMGITMLLLSPCLVIFPLVYLFLRHAEEFYNHPSTASSRRWSNLSRWILREFNEVEHFFKHRMNNSTVYSLNYFKQFPTPLVSIVAKFISFVSGGLAGILLILGFLGESILEGHKEPCPLWSSRHIICQKGGVVKRAANLCEVNLKLYFSYSVCIHVQRVDDILLFISDFTVYVDGVGDVCRSHGNRSYGSPVDAVKSMRSSQGKMEKSLVSFQSTYISWEPNTDSKKFLCNLQKFKETQIREHTFQAVEASQDGLSTRGQSAQIFHRLLPRNIQPSNGIIYDSPLGLLDTDRRACPYILDWYYTHHLPHSDTEDNATRHPDESSPDPGEDLWPPQSKPLTEIEEEDPWDSDLYERARSYLEASTSSALFQCAAFKRQGKEQNYTSRQWWAQSSARSVDLLDSFLEPPGGSFLEPAHFRNNYDSGHYSSHHSDRPLTSSQPTSPQGSFLEPPNFGNYYTSSHHLSHHSEDLPSGTTSVQLDESNTRGSSSWRSPQALLKTRYMDDDFDMEQGLSFNFADVPRMDDSEAEDQDNGGLSAANIHNPMSASLTVRIIPRSSDPV
ncbi:autophagy-related protein 9 isoform X5 [Brachypodium distachyon]|uniref:autophagy-related protein 9 isoform X5 n=1 Tax=Brachypodium distachyon TaxID=15368 RepID=UPI000D0D496F|nr:autophagy-related protein 9 isoform X5 [Brachypodium distachyon]|eukprot:XP_024310169.1 autophagy-related protein 9 isoform X5 [Brachypodium distachyon]